MYTRNNLGDLMQQSSILTRNDMIQKRILLRTSFNVTIETDGEIKDITRLLESIPFIIELAKKCKKLIILAHLGRPTKIDKTLSLLPIYKILSDKLTSSDIRSKFIYDINEIEKTNEDVVLVENIRFFKGEESNDENERLELLNVLKNCADLYVNDAFSDYRESCSTFYITQHLKSYLGPNFIKEVNGFKPLADPKKPYIALIGGSKLSEKIDILNELCNYTDKVLIGGALAYTLLKARGYSIGKSLFEEDKLRVATELVTKYSDKIVLPVDHLISTDFSETSSYTSNYTEEVNIPNGKCAIDIGPKTIQIYKEIINEAKTILINGPLGVFEWDRSIEGTKILYETVLKNLNAYKIIGGGDSIGAINKLRLSGFDHISTGGGAMMNFISQKRFATLDCILDQFDSA